MEKKWGSARAGGWWYPTRKKKFDTSKRNYKAKARHEKGHGARNGNGMKKKKEGLQKNGSGVIPFDEKKRL